MSKNGKKLKNGRWRHLNIKVFRDLGQLELFLMTFFTKILSLTAASQLLGYLLHLNPGTLGS
jgi:hypothetical protein